MVRFRALALQLVFFALLTPSYSLLGADFSAKQLETVGNFVKGLKPVHGYWVNGTDTFFLALHLSSPLLIRVIPQSV